MARQIITKLLDDLDGGEADETVEFAFDGVGYTIDLSAKNASKLRDFMATYQEAGTRTGRVGSAPSLRTNGSRGGGMSFTANKEQNFKIRQWAGENGYELSERGRIPQYVVDAYNSGTPNPQVESLQAELDLQQPEEPAAKRPRKRAPAKAAFSK